MAPRTHLITYERACELFLNDPHQGHIVWSKAARKNLVGKIAGTVQRKRNRTNAYIRVSVDGVKHFVHNIITLLMTREYPPRDWDGEEVDHIDNNGLNNRWDNLRRATKEQQGLNAARPKPKRPHLPRGVSYEHFNGHHVRRCKYKARLRVNGQRLFLGWHKTPEEAHAALLDAEARHGVTEYRPKCLA